MNFQLVSKNKPAGDQPKAIRSLISGLKNGDKHQTLLGVTGSGKTFTIANVVEKIQKPTLVLAHNKTLAAQLCNEFRGLFPHNAVHYFVSYYDYYQPEAYLPVTDTYIDKEAMINDEIDKLRHAATTSLLTRRDVIIVASVSCIYGLGAPETYRANIIRFKVGDFIDRKFLIRKLVSMQFSRTNSDLRRGTFRVRGDDWEIMPVFEETIYNFRLEKNKIAEIFIIDPIKGFDYGKTPTVPSLSAGMAVPRPSAGMAAVGLATVGLAITEVFISPARHFLTMGDLKMAALENIKKELKERIRYFESEGKYLEAERLERRTLQDLAMLREVGYCHGIENYSRHLSGRFPGEPPATLLDYFPKDFLMIIDESHVTVPQLNGMYQGDVSRKKTLKEYGFRLPSAMDNRPLKFEEFENRMPQVIYTSATPGPYEKNKSDPLTGRGQIVEQIIRPTGLVDPKIVIRPARGQVEDLIPRIKERVSEKERVLVTTLTKRMAEDLSQYLEEVGMKVTYLHSDIKTLERIRTLTNLRRGHIDVLVGVNLLREGLDLPEVSLVAVLDADKEGFLRSETSLIQVIGRAARNVRGEVLIYADEITGSIKRAVKETERRRRLQMAYNKRQGITPKTIVKPITDILGAEKILDLEMKPVGAYGHTPLRRMIKDKEKEMKEAAKRLDFELAAILRNELKELRRTGKNSR